MDEEETKNCPNCKREIPAVNFTIHTVHCARNIKVCPVCKEPVPSSELDDHHQKFHKLLPCKQCGESVCGTDLEDHIRDSCANTIKTCRYCELELPRREVPAHEAYCGVRTEQCPECREWVMIKYRQLHLDSNHGFLRLDDDPVPNKKEPSKVNIRPARLVPTSIGTGNTNSVGAPGSRVTAAPPAARPTSIFNDAGTSNFRNEFPGSSTTNMGSSSSSSSGSPSSSSAPRVNGVKKRSNHQPQVNTDQEPRDKLNKQLPVSRGAVKKRPAPRPPRAEPRAEPRRDLPYYSALQRQQHEQRERDEQTQHNLAHGLPPVLSAAAKLEKLKRLDALQDPELAADLRRNSRRASPPPSSQLDFRKLKPMSPEQFMARFSELQVGGAGNGDRFREIKSSLRELRRGLNEVTAPYNNNNINANNNNDRVPASLHEEVQLPCEFCGLLVPADDLVLHQTGCRPDLAVYSGVAAAGLPAVAPGDPVIPCEFCARSLPVYLIAEHQEQCAREVDILSAD